MQLAKWGLQFTRHATNKHVQNSKRLLADLAVMSRELHQNIADQHEVDLQPNGIMMLCNTEKTFEHEVEIAEMAADLDLEANVLSMEEVRELDPNTNPQGVGGVHFPYDAYTEPGHFMAIMTKVLEQKGVTISYNTEVTDFVTGNGTVKEVVTNSGNFSAEENCIPI